MSVKSEYTENVHHCSSYINLDKITSKFMVKYIIILDASIIQCGKCLTSYIRSHQYKFLTGYFNDKNRNQYSEFCKFSAIRFLQFTKELLYNRCVHMCFHLRLWSGTVILHQDVTSFNTTVILPNNFRIPVRCTS